MIDLQNSVLWTVHSFNSAGLHVAADPRDWQDAVPKLAGDLEVMWEEFAVQWVGSRYDDRYCGGKTRFAISRSHLRRSLQEGCEAMAEAGYTSVQVRDYWEREVPEACRGDGLLLLMEYFVERIFYKLFDAVETVTKRNRQAGRFHGENSLGLLRKETATTVRAMKARLVEGGVEGLELWSPDFSALGMTMRRAKAGGGQDRTPVAEIYSSSKTLCDREEFDRMLRRYAPELDVEAWLRRIVESQQFRDDPEQLSLDCYQALSDSPARRLRNLERLLAARNGDGKA